MFMCNFKKCKNIIICVLCILCLVSLVTPVFAADDEFQGLANLAYKMVSAIYASEESSVIKDVLPILIYVPGESTDGIAFKAGQQDAMDEIWKFATDAYTALQAIAASIALLYFLLEILDKTTREMLSLEQFAVHFIKLLVVLFILNNGVMLIKGLLSINSEICSLMDPNKIAGISSESDGGYLAEVKKQLSIPIIGQFAGFAIIMELFIPYFGTLAVNAYIMFISWARFFELGLRTAFAPIGLLDIVTDGFKFSNLKYLKKLFAVILQGTIIVAIMRIVGQAQGALMFGDTIGAGYQYLIVMLTEIGLIKKANQFANDILGV